MNWDVALDALSSFFLCPKLGNPEGYASRAVWLTTTNRAGASIARLDARVVSPPEAVPDKPPEFLSRSWACGAHELALMQTPAESSADTGGGKTPGVRHVDPGDCVALPRHSTISASRYNFRVFLSRAFDWTVRLYRTCSPE